ncbi:MAG: 4a-hydroxytetrahydrobiopterin dehydratase [Bacteroidota bacterium]|nr:4a-hydroxytetrahydrobiopterin dehydratase [Bacteroidota bacterium]
MPALPMQEVETRLQDMKDWKLQNEQITRTFEAASFHRAIGFVTQIAILADKADHHPDIDIRYSTVVIALATHSEGGITEKDFSLAKQIDEAFAQ